MLYTFCIITFELSIRLANSNDELKVLVKGSPISIPSKPYFWITQSKKVVKWLTLQFCPLIYLIALGHSYLNHSRATAQNLFIVQIKLHTQQSIQNIIRNIKTNLVGIKDWALKCIEKWMLFRLDVA